MNMAKDFPDRTVEAYYHNLTLEIANNTITKIHPVAVIVKRLRLYYHLHKSLVFMLSAWIIKLKGFEIKLTLAEHLFLHAQAAEKLKQRLEELRFSPTDLEKYPTCLKPCFDFIMQSESTESFVLSLHAFLAMVRAEYEAFINDTNEFADAPTLYSLKHIMLDQEKIMGDLEKLSNIIANHFSESYVVNHVGTIKQKLNGIMDFDSEYSDDSPFFYQRQKKCVRDPRFKTFSHTRDYRKADSLSNEISDQMKRELFEMIRTQRDEIDAVETFANVLYDIGYQIHFDLLIYLSRIIWDESRHAIIGQKLLENLGYDPFSVPCGTIGIDVRSELSPQLSLAQINIFGESNIVRDIYKMSLLAESRGYTVIARALNFIYMDEVMHIKEGRKWLKYLFNNEKFSDIQSKAREASIQQLHKLGIENIDYTSALSDQELGALIGE